MNSLAWAKCSGPSGRGSRGLNHRRQWGTAGEFKVRELRAHLDVWEAADCVDGLKAKEPGSE